MAKNNLAYRQCLETAVGTLDTSVYWRTAIGLIDTWVKYLSSRELLENADNIYMMKDEKKRKKVEEDKSEYDELVDITLRVFELVCIAVHVEPITRYWLEENLSQHKKHKRLRCSAKKFLAGGYQPVALGGI